MGLGIIDTHAHYDDTKFDDIREELIDTLLNGGDIDYIVNASFDLASSYKSVEFTKKYKQFYAWCGIHPSDCEKYDNQEDVLCEIEKMLKEPKVVGIGEIGLDFHYEGYSREKQENWFEAQMDLARKNDVPVAIHDRDAHGACMDIIKKYPGVKGILHSFSGSVEMASELLKLGWYISFSGVVTFKNAQKAKEVAKFVPLDRMLIETDAPYLSPEPYRGTLNNSGNLIYTSEAIAKIKEVSLEEICNVTAQNAKELLNIK